MGRLLVVVVLVAAAVLVGMWLWEGRTGPAPVEAVVGAAVVTAGWIISGLLPRGHIRR